ncbi:hypothetical protein C8R43DRAFT_956074 [Mycena crocata]|nr:hypothetical protein C8R43DRAFT_956074 [Mycena crocata]
MAVGTHSASPRADLSSPRSTAGVGTGNTIFASVTRQSIGGAKQAGGRRFAERGCICRFAHGHEAWRSTRTIQSRSAHKDNPEAYTVSKVSLDEPARVIGAAKKLRGALVQRKLRRRGFLRTDNTARVCFDETARGTRSPGAARGMCAEGYGGQMLRCGGAQGMCSVQCIVPAPPCPWTPAGRVACTTRLGSARPSTFRVAGALRERERESDVDGRCGRGRGNLSLRLVMPRVFSTSTVWLGGSGRDLGRVVRSERNRVPEGAVGVVHIHNTPPTQTPGARTTVGRAVLGDAQLYLAGNSVDQRVEGWTLPPRCSRTVDARSPTQLSLLFVPEVMFVCVVHFHPQYVPTDMPLARQPRGRISGVIGSRTEGRVRESKEVVRIRARSSRTRFKLRGELAGYGELDKRDAGKLAGDLAVRLHPRRPIPFETSRPRRHYTLRFGHRGQFTVAPGSM